MHGSSGYTLTSDKKKKIRNVSQKNWIQAKGEIESSFAARRGAGVSGSFDFAYSGSISVSGCTRAAVNHLPVAERREKGV